MDAVEFLKERKRMCAEYKSVCTKCPLARKWTCTMGKYIEEKEAREAVEIVEKWAEEHPVKTYKSEYLRAAEYVGAKPTFGKEGIPVICLIDFYGKDKQPTGCFVRDRGYSCVECWEREIK